MSQYHLAQINIAHALDTMESAVMKGFVDRLDEINALAEQSEGFVWRLQTEDGDATSIKAFADPNIIVNMSVWQNIASLRNFVYKSTHIQLMKNKSAWFKKMISVHQTLWWIPEGHIPTVAEGKNRLTHLQEHGATSTAFTFAKPFQQP